MQMKASKAIRLHGDGTVSTVDVRRYEDWLLSSDGAWPATPVYRLRGRSMSLWKRLMSGGQSVHVLPSSVPHDLASAHLALVSERPGKTIAWLELAATGALAVVALMLVLQRWA